MLQLNTTGSLTGYTKEFTSTDGFWQLNVPNELFGTYDGTTGALYSKMFEIGKEGRNWGTGNNGAKVGALVNGNERWEGTIGDVIVFDKVLDETERQKLSSYLSIKYGYTLVGFNYLSSQGDTVWDVTKNTGYHYNIAGIARDDNGSLLQKQSNSTNAGAQVIINVGKLANTNLGNIGNIKDGQYLIWGDNGESLRFTQPIIIDGTGKNHADRIWKVQNTGTVEEVQVAIPATAVPATATLLSSDSENFAGAKEKALTSITVNGTDYYAADITFSNGDFFTFSVPAQVNVILTEPAGTVADSRPTFKGTATPGATVSVKVNGIELTTKADANGNWSVRPIADLPDGSYDVEVTGEKNGNTSDPDERTIIIATVDKSQLQARVDMIDDLDENDYTTGSWQYLEPELTTARDLLTNPNATQQQINDAYDALKAKYDALERNDNAVDKTILGNKLTAVGSLVLDDYTPSSWATFKQVQNASQTVFDDPDATQAEVNQALENLIGAEQALVQKGGLSSLTPSTGSLTPSFSNEVYNYSMNVGNGTSQMTFALDAIDPNATVTTTANGELVTDGNVPLKVGSNTVVFKVDDGTGTKTYTITVNRASAGGGGSGTPTAPAPSGTKETIDVNLEIDGDNPVERTSVTIERTRNADGSVHDTVQLTLDKAQEAVAKAKQIGNDTARIVIPDAKDEVDEVKVDISRQSLLTLRDNGINLEILTDNVRIELPISSMDGIDDDFYFRLVPIKEEGERNEIEERARVEQVVRAIAGNEQVEVVARPMTIETNLSSRPVTLTLPLKGVDLPTDSAEREAFLNGLGVFIEHSDGEKEVVFGEIATMANGELGIRFSISKFSTFTIINFDEELHVPYIKGFPNGLFKPNEAVTRAQIAALMARNLGYTGTEQTSIAPFPDVNPSHYASGVIRFMKESGLMTGDPSGYFRPNDTITRAEMATVVANYKQFSNTTAVAPSFNDTKGHWAEAIIEATREAGYVNGYENGQFRPNSSLTRAEAVAILNRVFDRGPLHGVTTPSFPDVRSDHWAFNDIEEAATPHRFHIDENGREQLVK